MQHFDENLIDALAQALPTNVLHELQQISDADIGSLLQEVSHRGQQGPSTNCFLCGVCGKSFNRKSSLHSHKNDHKNSFSCQPCDYTTNRKGNWKRHVKTKRHLENRGNEDPAVPSTSSSSVPDIRGKRPAENSEGN